MRRAGPLAAVKGIDGAVTAEQHGLRTIRQPLRLYTSTFPKNAVAPLNAMYYFLTVNLDPAAQLVAEHGFFEHQRIGKKLRGPVRALPGVITAVDGV